MRTWINQTAREVLQELGGNAERGLTSQEAAARLKRDGPNRLTGRGGRNPWRILLEQLSSLMVILLIVAALVSGLVLGEHEDAVVILIVVVLNAMLGFRQEFKAEKAMEALRRMSVPHVRVLRDGAFQEIQAVNLVEGDIIRFEAGNLVPADCRLIEAANLRIQESALTGEAEAVAKQTAPLNREHVPLGDRTNMAFRGTTVTYGRGLAVVTATGMHTELGHIATLIQEAEDEDTVLQRKLNQLSRILVIAAMILIGVVALEAWLIQHMPPQAIFMTAVSMAVAAIPEGLPAVVTIALALGAQRMLRRHALIRKLPAVETLGSVTVICSDKTGTLTQNRMTVTALDMPTSAVDLAMGERKRSEMLEKFMQENSAAGLMLAAGALCSDAEIRHEDDRIRIMGDPTEGALVMAAAWAGWSKSTLEQLFPRVDERPFDAERKRMTTVHHLPGANQQIPVSLAGVVKALNRHHAGRVAFTKGAVGSLLEVADRIWVNGKTEPLTPVWRQRIEQENEKRAADGVRVLGIGWHEMSAEDEGRDPETDVVFLGMIGMLDPLREEVKDAVHTCHSAGIRPVMITGDHPLIALNIGRGLGLTEKSAVCTGVELAQLSNEQLCKSVQDTSIYARVAPEHKLRIVDALQHNGEIVAMTGDGVNDAPALKEADIGVAMGITGTDVSKGAADMILQDDNFTTIVAAVEQGRVILDNIIRFVRFILSSNWAEILVMLAAPLFGLPLPLFAVQILWMNLVTDGLPALALGVEPGDRDVMRRPPRHPDAPIIDVRTAVHILLVGACMAGFSLWLGSCFFALSGSAVAACPNAHGQVMTAPGVWQTMLFSVLVFSQLALALAERSDRSSFMKIGFFTNPHMVGAVCLTFGLQVAVIYIPFLQRIFKTQSLTIGQLGLCILFSSATWAVVEIKKWMLRLFAK